MVLSWLHRSHATYLDILLSIAILCGLVISFFKREVGHVAKLPVFVDELILYGFTLYFLWIPVISKLNIPLPPFKWLDGVFARAIVQKLIVSLFAFYVVNYH